MSLKVIDNGNIRQNRIRTSYLPLTVTMYPSRTACEVQRVFCRKSSISTSPTFIVGGEPLHISIGSFAQKTGLPALSSGVVCLIPSSTQGSHRPQTPPHVGLLYVHVILLTLYTHGHYVQAWFHKYSTHPLRPSRPWLQEIVPSVRCLQRVFVRTKPRLRTCEPHCLSLAATSSSQLAYVLIWRHPQNRKYASYHYAIRGGPSHSHKKMVKIRRVVPEIWSRTDKHTNTDRHIRSAQYSALPYRGRSNNNLLC